MKKYIAAISGGPDSMALLNKYHKNIIAVCSVDYNKRKNSYLDNEKVKRFCDKHNINFHLLTVNQEIYDKYHSSNFQDMARKIRYDFFIQIAQQYKNYNLLVAHNYNDWLETAYMQFNKKSKSLYYGIRKKAQYQSLNIFRPLIKIKKDNLLNYCIKHNIEYAIDYTNEMDIYQRNKIRKIIKEWNTKEYLNFYWKIKGYNFKNLYKNYAITKLFNRWKNNQFDYTLFISSKPIQQYYLTYYLLSYYNERNNSSNKINNLICFLRLKNNKQYRLENNKIIYWENDKIKVKNKEELCTHYQN